MSALIRKMFVSVVACLPCVVFAQSTPDLQKTLDRMNQSAVTFRAAQASFSWTMYNSVINEVTDTQQGTIYFRKAGKDVQMAALFSQPASKQVVFVNDKIQVAQPGGQVDVYDATTHREEFETFLVLGFGGSGTDMTKSFDVKDLGPEKIGSIDTEKLELTPKAENIKQHVPKIDLWIDSRGLAVQQQLWEEGGDYRLAKYPDIQLKQKIPDNVFKLKTNGKTEIVHH